MKTEILSPQQLIEQGAEVAARIRTNKAQGKLTYGSLQYRKRKTKLAHEKARADKEKHAAVMESFLEAYWAEREIFTSGSK
jgi:lysyl-tRNA synthetase class II